MEVGTLLTRQISIISRLASFRLYIFKFTSFYLSEFTFWGKLELGKIATFI